MKNSILFIGNLLLPAEQNLPIFFKIFSTKSEKIFIQQNCFCIDNKQDLIDQILLISIIKSKQNDKII